MKALSIRQPWAWLIANGHKSIENRNWNTKFRGSFLIHASQKVDKDAYGFLFTDEFLEIWKKTPPPHEIETGGFIGVADLIHVVHEYDRHHLTERDKPWFFGEYGFVLENARTIPFIPYKGQLGFFDVPEDIASAAQSGEKERG